MNTRRHNAMVTSSARYLVAESVKEALEAIRSSTVSGSAEMAEVDAQWLALFGDSLDAPWKAQS